MDHPKPIFTHIDRIDEIKMEMDGEKVYDLFVTCDVSARGRLAVAGEYFDSGKRPFVLTIMSVIKDLHRKIMCAEISVPAVRCSMDLWIRRR